MIFSNTEFKDVKEKLKRLNYQSSQISLIEQAFEFSKKVHAGQKRASGEDYIFHPVGVCEILTDLNMDHETLAASLLHDTVEDTSCTLDDIEKNFGENIRHLVDGVTKIGHLKFNSLKEERSENIKKIFFAMKHDIRVVIIKLADRLHNARTLGAMNEEHQKKKSTETLEIYAPLAGRLGMNGLKTELEDISFFYLMKDQHKEVQDNLSKNKKARNDYILKTKKQITDFIQNKVEGKFEVSGRVKNLYSIFKKTKSKNIPFHQIHDILAFRVCVETISDCYLVLGLIHSMWTPVPARFKDFIANSKENNYQSLHTTVVTEDKQRIEVQIRTFEMHKVAEYGIASHWTYKEKRNFSQTQKDMVEKFSWLRELVTRYQSTDKTTDFLDDLKSDLQEIEINVFTPKGSLKTFPKKATVIDMAFSIHSDLGHSVTGAIVNGQIQPLKYELKDGDVLEILTSKSQNPSADWLNFCITSKARSHIRSYLRSLERLECQKIGEKQFSKLVKKQKASLNTIIKSDKFQSLLKEKVCQKKEDLFTLIGYEKWKTEDISDFIGQFSDEKTVQNEIIPKAKTSSKKSQTSIQVEGEDAITVSLSKCCYPVPGDDILGFVTRGRGIMIHRSNCPQAESADPERQVDVRWSAVTFNDSQKVKLKVFISKDRVGVLKEITEAIGLYSLNIEDISTQKSIDNSTQCSITVEVRDKKQLEELISYLGKIKSVDSVERA